MQQTPQQSQANLPNTGSLLNEIGSEVSQESAPLLQFITEHGLKIAALVGLLLIITSASFVWKWYQNKTAQEILDEKVKIELTLKGPAQLEALQQLLERAPSKLQTLLALTLASHASKQQDYAKAAQAYAKAAQLDADGAMSSIATLAQASALLRENKNQEAVALLQANEARLGTPLPLYVKQMLADAAIRAGQEELASSTYKSMLNDLTGEDQAYVERLLDTLKSKAQTPTEAKKAQ
ncbi:MAG: tetratricopeptide repeat protein [Desulfovibrionaceae bacterium]|nr:tetratricopeptide repeat protein [Desulfovibrionaceae bacterium]